MPSTQTGWPNRDAVMQTDIQITRRTVTASENLAASDFDGSINMIIVDSASNVVLTVPPGLTPLHSCSVFRKGAGEVTIAAGTGVTLLSDDSRLSLDAKYTAASIFGTGVAEEYAVVGKLKA